MSNFLSLPPPPGSVFYQNSVDINLIDVFTYVVTEGFSRFNLYSDSTVDTNRQIVLTSGDIEGQQITLILQSGNSTTCILSTISTSYVRLTSSWIPLQYQQITLQWSKGLWIEINRTDTPLVPPTPEVLIWEPIVGTGWSSSAFIAKSFDNIVYMRGSFSGQSVGPVATIPVGYVCSLDQDFSAVLNPGVLFAPGNGFVTVSAAILSQSIAYTSNVTLHVDGLSYPIF